MQLEQPFIFEGSITDGAGLGHRAYLLQYETERQRHNVPTMLAIDSLQKLYSTTLTPVVLAGSLMERGQSGAAQTNP